ncbi:hypothetical protein M569_14004, partial [Genlisea aurea]
MGAFDEQVSITGEWMPPSPTARSFFSSATTNDEDDGIAAVGCKEEEEERERRITSGNSDEHEGDAKPPSNSFFDSKATSRGNLVERMAARAGFNAPRLNPESFRPPGIPKHSDGQPPFVMTIPPGLSPTTLLESPVLPSPTTGKFSFGGAAPCGNGGRSSSSSSSALVRDDDKSFVFKTVAESIPVPCFD